MIKAKTEIVCAGICVRKGLSCISKLDKNLQMNQYWSLSEPCSKVLFCRQVMHCFHFEPVLVLFKATSSQTMSDDSVLDEFGSDLSNVEESRHIEEQGEFGVT